MIENFPTEPNLRRNLALELRLNAVSLGRKDEADLYLAQEIRADRGYNWNKVLRKSSYYRDHYQWMDQIGAAASLLLWWINDLSWGHGLDMLKLLRSLIVLISAFTFLIWLG
jgi:hypothetical protein